MGHVHNDRLLPAGLGAGASILHKTGDIGKMLEMPELSTHRTAKNI